jgi:hypothetical protein
MRRTLLISLLLSSGAGAAAFAQDGAPAAASSAVTDPATQTGVLVLGNQPPWPDGKYYLSPLASYVFPDNGRVKGNGNGEGAALALGWQASSWAALEIAAQYSWINPAALYGFGAHVLLFPTPSGFYFLGGGGYGRVRSEPGVRDYGTQLLQGGFGYRWGPFKLLGEDAYIRSEALLRLDRHHAVSSAGDSGGALRNYEDGVLNLVLVLPFGPKAHPSAVDSSAEPVRVVPLVVDEHP